MRAVMTLTTQPIRHAHADAHVGERRAELLPQVQTLERLLDQSAPLPQEPVGPGGSWQARMSLHVQNIPVTQTSVYTLASTAPRSGST